MAIIVRTIITKREYRSVGFDLRNCSLYLTFISYQDNLGIDFTGCCTMSIFDGVSGDQLTYIASTMAVSLSKGLNNNDIEILGNLLNAVGDNLTLISSRNEAESGKSNSKDEE